MSWLMIVLIGLGLISLLLGKEESGSDSYEERSRQAEDEKDEDEELDEFLEDMFILDMLDEDDD